MITNDRNPLLQIVCYCDHVVHNALETGEKKWQQLEGYLGNMQVKHQIPDEPPSKCV